MMFKTTACALLYLFLCTALSAADYYWVGGTGDWSDISHWATTSGGSTFHNQAPTSNDNVFFDNKSFTGNGEVVTINTDIIFCRNMDWTGATGGPAITGLAKRTLNIYGSITLIDNMTFDFAGSIRMLALDPGHTIQAPGQVLGNSLTFEGNGGSWTLQSELLVDSIIQLRNGSLITNGQAVTAGYMDVRINNAGALDLGASKLTLQGATFVVFNQPVPVLYIQTANFTLTAADAEIELSAAPANVEVEGSGPVAIGSLIFSADDGQSLLKAAPGTNLDLKRLSFSNTATIEGVVATGRLTLAAGKAYTFESGITYTIGRLDAPGQCEAPIQLFGSVSGTAAIFSSANGPVQVSYASIKDIQATGGANFTAGNSADLGNNDGWNINTSAQTDLFWVGGTGDWSDPMHWSFTSGGPGGACVPTGANNVFFDNNSFSGPANVVTINVENALCRNMNWTGAGGTPILDGPLLNKLRIYGSLRFIPNMVLDYAGDVYFESSSPGNTIRTGNHLFNHHVYFNGNGGAWSLSDSLKVTQRLELISGFLGTNDQAVVCEQFLSQSLAQRQLLLGSSHIELRQLDLNMGGVRTCQFWLQIENLIFDAGSSWIEFSQYGQLRTDGKGAINFFEVSFAWYSSVRSNQQAELYVHELTFMSEGNFQYGFKMGTLIVSPGFEYQFDSGETFTINKLQAPGLCNALIFMRATNDDQEALLDSPNDLSGDYLILRDLHNVSGNTFTANNSINTGNNLNWQIDQLTPRTLFWVGGTGNWSDQAHWSLASGGPGGECIPTPIDDVFFDENSFDQAGQLVADNFPTHYCHNLTWQNITTNPEFSLGDLLVFGSVELAEEMLLNVYNFRFLGDESGHTINTRAHPLVYANFQGAGDWMLLDSFNAYWVGMTHGGWNTNGFPVDLSYFSSSDDQISKRLTLGGTHMTLDGELPTHTWSVSGDIVIEADSSLIELTSSSATFYNRLPNAGELTYNKVLFSAKEGQSVVNSWGTTRIHAAHLQFDNNGIIYGSNTFDTLIFAPGKAYQLQAQGTQTIVDYWQIIGNNCVPIQLSSTEPGVKSIALMASGQVDGDFIQMRDQEATGGADFYAGTHSTNVGNSNTGWIFDSAEDFVEVGFLGQDRVLCNNATIVLDADNKGADETYRWQDGSMGATFTVPSAGTYWAEVSFTNNCTIRDSIKIIPPEDFTANLGNDTTLCTGSGLLLDATFDALGITYLWQDGSTDPTFPVDAPGNYKVEMELTGCFVQDSIQVAYFDPPVLDVAADQTLCFNTTLDLDATIADAVAYAWQDGSTSPVIQAALPGIYWVDVDFAHCIRRDTVAIDYYPEIVVNLGPDTTLCETESVVINAAQANATYSWQDGSTASSFTAGSPAVYWVDVNINGCTARDSMEVFYNPLPVFDLGPDLQPCRDELPRLLVDVPGASYSWQDGSTFPGLEVAANGIYWVDVNLNGCIARDSVAVDYVLIPELVLGEDRIVCEGQQIDFDVTYPGATYRWQDGATSPTYRVTESGDYAVVISVQQCSESDEVSLMFNPTPSFNLANDTLLCQGETLRLRMSVFADEYRWSDGSSAPDLTVSYPGGMVWAEAKLDDCPFRDSVFVDFRMPPTFDLGQDTLICEDFSVTLSAGVAADAYRWQDGSTSSSIQTSGTGLYALEVTDGPCVVVDSVFVTTRPCIYFDVFVPNAFSPNSDGINDVLRPMLPTYVQIQSYRFKVYDRWGTEVFTTTNMEEGWDGMLRSLPLPMGVYIYFVEFEYTDDRGSGSDLITGDIMLMR